MDIRSDQGLFLMSIEAAWDQIRGGQSRHENEMGRVM